MTKKKITKDMDGLEQTKIFFSTLWRILRFPILIVVLFFILINVAFGAVQEPDPSIGAWQTDGSTKSTNSYAFGDGGGTQYIASSTTNFSTSSWAIKMRIDCTSGGDCDSSATDLRISMEDGSNLCEFDIDAGLTGSAELNTPDCNDWNGVDLAPATSTFDSSNDEYLFTFGNDFEIKDRFAIRVRDNAGDSYKFYGVGTDEYNAGHACITSGNAQLTSLFDQTCTEFDNLKDMFFILSETGDPISQDGGEQAFVDPVDQENKQEDFDIWRVETSIGADATSTADSDILDTYAWTVYVNTTTTFGNNEQDNITSLPESVIAPGETSTLGLSKNTALPSGNYFARSELWYVADEDGDGDLEASEVTILASDEIEFSIDPFSPATYEDPSTATTTDLTVTCDPDSGFFQESLCKMNQTLFIPDPDAVRQFEGLGDEVRNKPPWGYFFVVKDELNKLKSTTTEAYSMPDTSALDSTFDDLKTTVSVILWFVFAVWIVTRFKHIN